MKIYNRGGYRVAKEVNKGSQYFSVGEDYTPIPNKNIIKHNIDDIESDLVKYYSIFINKDLPHDVMSYLTKLLTSTKIEANYAISEESLFGVVKYVNND